jgi:hypothetical protein
MVIIYLVCKQEINNFVRFFLISNFQIMNVMYVNKPSQSLLSHCNEFIRLYVFNALAALSCYILGVCLVVQTEQNHRLTETQIHIITESYIEYTSPFFSVRCIYNYHTLIATPSLHVIYFVNNFL